MEKLSAVGKSSQIPVTHVSSSPVTSSRLQWRPKTSGAKSKAILIMIELAVIYEILHITSDVFVM